MASKWGAKMLLFSAAMCAIPVFSDSIQAAPRQTLTSHVPASARPSNYVGPVPATNRIRLVFGLPLRNQQGLTAFLRDVYNPASPYFRKYLTPQQFTERYGPSTDDYQAVVTFLKSSGFAKVETHPN